MQRFRVAAVVVALALAVLLAACSDTTAPTSAAASSSAPPPSSSAVAEATLSPGQHDVTFDVGGTARTATVVVPAADGPRPLVFVFHGHGGQGEFIQRGMAIETLWPDAVVVYPDGLPGHKGITDPEGVKSGWQSELGELEDRDLAFYDVMLSTLRAGLSIDGERIYAMGVSNGSQFAALVLNQRGDDVAAVANLSAPPGARIIASDPVRSMFVSLGMEDPLVRFELAKLTIPLIESRLGVDTSNPTVDGLLRSEFNPDGVELATYLYPGGHAPPPEIPPLVVEFFQRHTLSG